MSFSKVARRQEKEDEKEYKRNVKEFIADTKERKKSGYIQTRAEMQDTEGRLMSLARQAENIKRVSGNTKGTREAYSLYNKAAKSEYNYRKSTDNQMRVGTLTSSRPNEQNNLGIFGTNKDPRAGLNQAIANASEMRRQDAIKKQEEADRERSELESLDTKSLNYRISSIEKRQQALANRKGIIQNTTARKPNLSQSEADYMKKELSQLDSQYDALEEEKAKYKNELPNAAARSEEKKLTDQEKNTIQLYTKLKRSTVEHIDNGLGDFAVKQALAANGGNFTDWGKEKPIKNEDKYQAEFDRMRKKGIDVDYLIDYYKTQADNKEQEDINRFNKQLAGESPLHAIANSVASVIASPVGAVQGIGEDIRHFATSSDEKPLPINQKNRSLANYTQSARQGVSDKIDNKFWNFIYNAGMSTADSAVAIGLGAATGGAGTLGSAVTQGIMSVGAADNTYNEAVQRGIDPGRALATGILAGATEWFTEKYSIDGLKAMALKRPDNIKQVFKNIGKQMATEGSEEAASDIMNTVTDNIINGKKSEYNQAVKSYREQGLTLEQAKKAAMMDWLGNTASDALAGAFSGALMGVGGQVAGYKNTQNQMNDYGENINKVDSSESVVKYAKKFDDLTEQTKKAEKKLGKKAENKEAGFLADAVEEKVIETIDTATNATELEDIYNDLSEDAPQSVKVTIDQKVSEKAKQLSSDASEGEVKLLNRISETADTSLEQNYNEIKEKLGENKDETNIGPNKEVNTEPALKIVGVPADSSAQAVETDEGTVEEIAPQTANKSELPKIEPRVFNHTQAKLEASGEPVKIDSFVNIGTDKVGVKIDGSDDVVPISELNFDNRSVSSLYTSASKMDDAAAASAMISNYNGKMDASKYYGEFEKAYNWGTVGYNYDGMMSRNIFTIPEHITKLAYMLGQNKSQENFKEDLEESNKIREGKKSYKKGEGKITDERKDSEDLEKSVMDNIDEKLAKKLGINIKQVDELSKKTKDGVKKINGKLDLSNAEITFSEAAESAFGVRIHESLELAEAVSPAEYRIMMNEVLNFALRNKNTDDDLYNTIMNYRSSYRGVEGKKTFAEAADEFLNDAISSVFMNEEGAREFVAWLNKEDIKEADKKGILQSIVDIIDKLLEKLTALFENSKKTKAQEQGSNIGLKEMKKIREMYFTTLDNAAYIYKDSNNEGTEELKKAASAPVSHSVEVSEEKEIDKTARKIMSEAGITNKDFKSYNGTIKKMINYAKNRYLSTDSNPHPIYNSNAQKNVYITEEGIKETFGHDDFIKSNASHKRMKIAVMEDIEDIIKNADLEKEHADSVHPGDTRKFTYLNGIKEYGDKKYKIHMDCLEKGDKLLFHIHKIKELNEPSEGGSVGLSSSNNRISHFENNAIENDKKVEKNAKDSEGRTLTPEQQEFFKDSKIVDENGDLRVVYHGTSEDFTVFDSNKSRANMDIQGSFFSPWEIDAEGYGEKVGEYYLNITNPAPEGIAYKTLNKYKGQNNAGIKARDELERLGYDGVNNGDEEYIAFYPEQIKLVSNNSPTNNPDIRFSAATPTETSNLIKENEHLKKMVEKLQQEFELTGGQKPNPTTIKRVANKFLKQYNSSYDVDELANDITSIYAYLRSENGNGEVALKKMSEVARAILEKGGDTVDNYKDLRSYLKKTAISFTDEQKSEIANAYDNFGNFRNSMMGKLKITNDGASLEDIWNSDLQHMAPELFSLDVSAEEMPLILADVMQAIEPRTVAFGNESAEQGAYDLAMQIYTELSKVKPMQTFADKQAERFYNAMKKVTENYEQMLEDYRKSIAEKNGTDIKEALDEFRKEKARRIAENTSEIKALLEGKKNARSPKTLADYDKRVKKLEAENKRLRNLKDEEIAKLRAKYNNQRHADRERRTATETKNKIRKLHDKFSRMILKPTETMYVPKDLVPAAVAVCNVVNPGYGEGTKLRKALDEARAAFPKVSQEDGILASDFDPRIADEIDELARLFDEKPEGWSIKDASLEELMRIHDAMNGIYECIRMSTKLIREDGEKNARKAGLKWIDELRESKGVKTWVGKKLDNMTSSFLNSYREFRKLSGYNDNGEIMETWRELNRGQRKMFECQQEGNERLANGYGDSKAVTKMLEKLDSDLVKVPLNFKSGNAPVMITRGMRLSLIMHGKSQANMRHMMLGGIDIPANMKTKDKKKRYENLRHVQGITYDAIKQMEMSLTSEERTILEAMQDLFWNWSGEKINETSNKLYGFERARVKNYFPITVNKDYVASDISALKFDKTIEGAGFLKERVTSNNPIILDNIVDVADKTIHSTSMFNGLAIPIRNFNKIINTGTYELSDADADGAAEVLNSDAGKKQYYVATDSVKKALRDKWGMRARDYIDNLVADLQQARSRDFTWYDKLRGNYAGAVLTANASVIIKQTSAYPTVAGIVGWGPTVHAMLRGGMNNHPLSKADVELINKYTPLYWYRNLGNNSRDLAEIRDMNSFVNKIPPAKFTKDLIQKVDIAMVGRFWYAAQYYVDKNFKTLEKGSEEYYKKVAEVFDRSVEETQSTNMVMQNADIMRNPGGGMKMITMFMGQGLQNFGIVYDNLANMRAKAKQFEDGKCTKEELKRARKDFANAVSSQLVSAAMFAGLAIVARALLHRMNPYRDDKEEITPESMTKKFFGDMMENMAGSVPFGSLIYEGVMTSIDVAKGDGFSRVYGQQDIVLGAISDLENSMVKFGKAIVKGEDILDAFNQVVKDGSKLAGVPYENVWNLGEGIVKHTIDTVNGDGLLSFSSDQKDPAAKVVTSYLKKAIDEKDTYSQEKYCEILYELGKTDKEINGLIAKQITGDEAIINAANAKIQGDYDSYTNTIKEYKDKGYPEAAASKAIESVIKKMNSDDAPKPTKEENKEKAKQVKEIAGSYMKSLYGQETKLYQSKDIASAVESGKYADVMKKFYDEKVKEQTEKGLSKEEAKKKAITSIKTALSKKYHAEYLDPDKTTHQRQQIVAKLQKLKVNGSFIYNQKDFERWFKELKKS